MLLPPPPPPPPPLTLAVSVDGDAAAAADADAFDFGTGTGSPLTCATVQMFIKGRIKSRHSSIPIISCNIEVVT